MSHCAMPGQQERITFLFEALSFASGAKYACLPAILQHSISHVIAR